MLPLRPPLRALIALAFLYAAIPATADEGAPFGLQALSVDGEYQRIAGFEDEGGRPTAFYMDNGEKVFVRDVSGLSIAGATDQALELGHVPERYSVHKIASMRPQVERAGYLIHSGISRDDIRRLWKPGKRAVSAVVVCWLEEDRIEVRRIANGGGYITLGFDVALQADARQGARGLPVVFVFSEGEALLPSSGDAASERLARIATVAASPTAKVPKSWILDAARDGNVALLRAILGDPATYRGAHKKSLLEALLLAAGNGRTEVARYLMSLGADPLARFKRQPPNISSILLDGITSTAASRTLWRNHADTFETLIAGVPGSLPPARLSELARAAVNRGLLEAAESLAALGYKPSSPEDLREWAIVSARKNRLDLLQQLVASAPFDLRDVVTPSGDNLLHLAAPYGDPELLEWLFEQGVPLDVPDKHGHTPLILAAGYSNLPAVCWLLDRGARIDHQNERGHTALQYAIVKQQSEAAACVFGYAPDIDKPGPHGVTPLMQAALFKDRYMAKALVDAGALWNFESSYSDPCLELALELDMPDILDAALLQGLDPDHPLYGKWPLAWAAAYFEAAACHERLAGTPLPDQATPSPSPLPLRLSEFDAKRALALAAKPLPARVRFRCLIQPDGAISLPVIRSELPRSDEQDLRNLLLTFRFDRGEARDHPWLAAELEIAADRNRQPFPEDIRTVSLRKVLAPKQTSESGAHSIRDTAASQPSAL